MSHHLFAMFFGAAGVLLIVSGYLPHDKEDATGWTGFALLALAVWQGWPS